MWEDYSASPLYKSTDGQDAVFFCEYFKGELKNDQLDKYFNVVKHQLESAELMSKGGMEIEAEEIPEKTSVKGKYLRDNLNSVMDTVNGLDEAMLENFISGSLIEAYGNVAGFRLAECSYNKDKLIVDGTIYFVSGRTRKTAYIFTEALSENNKVSIRGINEKLGTNKQFTINGYTSNNKTFITESFEVIKK